MKKDQPISGDTRLVLTMLRELLFVKMATPAVLFDTIPAEMAKMYQEARKSGIHEAIEAIGRALEKKS